MVWLEIRCEVLGEGCVSGRNEGPMAPSSHNRAQILRTIRGLEASALRQGWERTRTGLVCPACRDAGTN